MPRGLPRGFLLDGLRLWSDQFANVKLEVWYLGRLLHRESERILPSWNIHSGSICYHYSSKHYLAAIVPYSERRLARELQRDGFGNRTVELPVA